MPHLSRACCHSLVFDGSGCTCCQESSRCSPCLDFVVPLAHFIVLLHWSLLVPLSFSFVTLCTRTCFVVLRCLFVDLHKRIGSCFYGFSLSHGRWLGSLRQRVWHHVRRVSTCGMSDPSHVLPLDFSFSILYSCRIARFKLVFVFAVVDRPARCLPHASLVCCFI